MCSGALTAHPPRQSSIVEHAFSGRRLPSIDVGYDAHIADSRARVESVLPHPQINLSANLVSLVLPAFLLTGGGCTEPPPSSYCRRETHSSHYISVKKHAGIKNYALSTGPSHPSVLVVLHC